ncbi:EF-hand calcium-binding domain-containing protein 1 [Takifugu flavidus]|uniref:EF-hand calcium-binding domain-containing protein 1 n=1 Tax=Takifugu flavidus TaxID=433684 RepID=A0A5C6NCG3_9TELE|nr:EF-hand calcium-binding domain-containing protein 1 [Takifugu flavidus]
MFNKTEIWCLIREFNVLLEEQTSRGKAATGLDRAKFRSILHNFGVTSDVLMHGVFRTFDKDNDGFVSVKEWIEDCFQVYDLNGDGYISAEEMLYLLKDCLKEQPTEEDPDEGIRDLVEITLSNMDHDHDGRISFADFKKSVMGENLLLNAFGVCLPDTMNIKVFEQHVFREQQ